MLIRTVAEKAPPFDPLIPNAETVDAMMAARRGEVVRVGSVNDLLADLHADDGRTIETAISSPIGPHLQIAGCGNA